MDESVCTRNMWCLEYGFTATTDVTTLKSAFTTMSCRMSRGTGRTVGVGWLEREESGNWGITQGKWWVVDR